MLDTPEGIELNIFRSKNKNYHSNWLINSRHEFSLLEKKMLYCIINQLDVTTDVRQDLFSNLYFKIPISIFGQDYTYNNLKQAILKITTRTVIGGDDKSEHAFSITPVPFAEIKGGVVRLCLFAEAVPYFIDLKKRGYTSYELEVAMSLTSVYSQRMFELLGRWKDTGKWYGVDIEKFKFLMGVDKDKGYVKHSNLVNRILEPARRELAEKTNIEFEYHFEKEGRKFIRINFDIATKALIQHIKSADAKASATQVLTQLADATQGQQMIYLHTALAGYQFNKAQKESILKNQSLTLKFLEIHTQIEAGAVEVETTPTRLMAWHLRKLGWK
jgi:plasmid replication initiation protein